MDEKMRAAPDVAGLVGYQAELKEKINAVSRRSLDGSVVMSSEEWNGIVELVEKLLAAAPHPEAVQEPVGFIQSSGINELKAGHPARIYPAGSTPSPFESAALVYTHPHNGEQGDKRCSWWKDMADWDGNTWESDCGACWTFIDDGPAQNEMHFCPKCGRKLSQLPQPPKSKEDRGHE